MSPVTRFRAFAARTALALPLLCCTLLLSLPADPARAQAGPLTLPPRADAAAMLDTLSLCAVVCSFNFGSYADVMAQTGDEEMMELAQAYYQLALVSTGTAAAIAKAVDGDRNEALSRAFEQGDERLMAELAPVRDGGDEEFAAFQAWNEERIADCTQTLGEVDATAHLEALMALTGDALSEVLAYLPDVMQYLQSMQGDEPGSQPPATRPR